MCPAWEVREQCEVTSWFQVRLAFPDGARVDALAVVREGRVSIEDVSAQPALSLADLAVLADWIEGPLFASCGVERSCDSDGDERLQGRYAPESDEKAGDEKADQEEAGAEEIGDGQGGAQDVGAEEGGAREAGAEEDELWVGSRRARPVWPRGVEGRRLAAQEYRVAQEQGSDPVLAVMSATGHSRRRSLRLIAQARDAGFLTPRHARRD
ncbi:DUF6214 family protein [Streptomyces sp. RB17]|uniref:DUF6214 family protein n=1 Tax=Streptomyces sp. RB17 TaxID=2585197 RepID=UPI002B206AE6|nr:DUF6214 family protein [Streptomyces sp. RB17]